MDRRSPTPPPPGCPIKSGMTGDFPSILSMSTNSLTEVVARRMPVHGSTEPVASEVDGLTTPCTRSLSKGAQRIP